MFQYFQNSPFRGVGNLQENSSGKFWGKRLKVKKKALSSDAEDRIVSAGGCFSSARLPLVTLFDSKSISKDLTRAPRTDVD